MNHLSNAFTEIYSNNEWGSKKNLSFYSGPGSHFDVLIDPYVSIIEGFLKRFKKKQDVIDIGCGDFNIGKKIRPFFNNYLGIDIVKPLIEHNKKVFKDLDVKFLTIDLTQDTIPKTDVVIIRQVFQHLNNENILKILKNIYKKSKYLIITESTPQIDFKYNVDLKGEYHKAETEIGATIFHRAILYNSSIDITLPPFNFPIKEKVLSLSLKEKMVKKEYEKFLLKTNIYRVK